MEQTKSLTNDSLTNDSLTNEYPLTHNVNELIKKKIIINNIIYHKNKVTALHFNKNMIDLQIWDTCDHTWIRDHSAMFDDIDKYICSKCTLYKRRRLYVI